MGQRQTASSPPSKLTKTNNSEKKQSQNGHILSLVNILSYAGEDNVIFRMENAYLTV